MGSLKTLLTALMFLFLPGAAPAAPAPLPPGPKAESNHRAAFQAMRVAEQEGKAGKEQLSRAKELYEQMTSERAPSKWKKYATRWYTRGLRGDNMECAKGGRKHFIDDGLAKVIAEDWTQQGVGRGGSWRPYFSMEEVSSQGRAGRGTAAGCRCRRSVPPSLQSKPHRLLHRPCIGTQS